MKRPTMQLDMFEMLAADEKAATTAAKLATGIPKLYAHPGRGLRARLAAYSAWMQEWKPIVPFGCALIVKGWDTRYPIGEPTDTCQPIVLSADLRCDAPGHRYGVNCYCMGELVHRAFCLHCDWEADGEHVERDRAAMDGLDHAHPGWRESPIVEPHQHDGQMKVTKTWTAMVNKAYGPRPLGWPVITRRTRPGHGAVAGRSPWGGYDISSQSLEEYRPTA